MYGNAVIAIIVLVANAAAACTSRPEPISNPAATQSQLATIQRAIEAHRTAHGRLPNDIAALGLDPKLFVDHWGNSIVYVRKDDCFALCEEMPQHLLEEAKERVRELAEREKSDMSQFSKWAMCRQSSPSCSVEPPGGW